MLGNFQPHAVEYLRFLPEIILVRFRNPDHGP